MDRPSAHDYLLGELSADDRVEAERLIRDDPEFAATVARLRPLVSELEALPGEAWAEIPPLEPAAQETLAPGAGREERRERPKPRPTLWQRLVGDRPALAGGLAAAAAAVLAAVAVIGLDGEESSPAGPTLELAALPESGVTASARATLGEAGGDARVEIEGLDTSAEGEFYELWLLNDTKELVSLGSFRVEDAGETTVELPLPVDPEEYRFLDISVEEDDGDASHSGNSVLRGPIQRT